MTAGRLIARLLPPVLALACSLGVGVAFIAAIGQDPAEVVGRTWSAVFLNSRAIVTNVGYVLAETTPLVFAGLSVALAFQAGLINIGSQGQIVVACFACAWAGFTVRSESAWVMVPVCALAALAGGGLWGAIPGALRAFRGSHEVILTIMMNFVAVAATQYLTNVHFKAAGMIPQTEEIVPAARLPRMSAILRDTLGWEFPPSIYLGASLFFALAAVAGVWFFLRHTRGGYELRAVGQNPAAAECAGIGVRGRIVLAMTLAGALAGLVALDFVMGYKYRFHQDDAVGYGMKGFMGLAVAILGHHHPVGVLLAALLFGAISRIGFVMSFETAVPKDLILVLQGVIILALIVSSEGTRRFLLRRQARATGEARA